MHDARRWQAKGGRYNGEWRSFSRALREAHVIEHGHVCPGWDRDSHELEDGGGLVVDHDVGVLCRSCNAVKAATFDKR